MRSGAQKRFLFKETEKKSITLSRKNEVALWNK
jgi:hypothetical protein